LALDDDYLRDKHIQYSKKEQPKNIVEGFSMAGMSLVKGFAGGISGLVLNPIKGAKKVFSFCLVNNKFCRVEQGDF
jgi:hypothetical protein